MTTRILMGAALIGAALLLGACSADQSAMAGDKATAAVECPNCKTKWVRTQKSYGSDYVVVYHEEPVTVCTGCDATARQHLSGTSKNLHCDMCGHDLITVTPDNTQ